MISVYCAMREINLLKHKGTPFSSPPPRQGQSFSIIMAVVFVLLIIGIAYFYLTIHLPLRHSVTQLKIDLAQSRMIIVNQEHSLNDLSKKVSQYETTITQLKNQPETQPLAESQKPPTEKSKEKEESEIKKARKKEEKPKPVASISKHHPYVLHIASFRKSKTCSSDINLWQKRGYTPFVVLTKVPNKGYWYRLYLNRFEALAHAKRLALTLKRENLLDTAVPMKLPYALEPLESDEGIWQRLKRKGYSPYTLAPAKILIGAYAARHEAEEASRRLAAEDFPNRIVMP